MRELDFAVSQKVAKYKKMEWTGLVVRVNGTDGIDSDGEVHVLNGPSRPATEDEINDFHERRWTQYKETFDNLAREIKEQKIAEGLAALGPPPGTQN
jgi:hypothetical protein